MTPADIFAALPALSADDLRRVHERCTALLKLGGQPVLLRKRSSGFDLAQALYDAVNDRALLHMPELRTAPYAVFVKQAQGRRYIEAMRTAEALHAHMMRGALRSDGSYAAQQSMCRLYAGVIVSWARSRSLPLMWPVFIIGVRELPAFVEDAFPGYRRSGTLALVRKLHLHPIAPFELEP